MVVNVVVVCGDFVEEDEEGGGFEELEKKVMGLNEIDKDGEVGKSGGGCDGDAW